MIRFTPSSFVHQKTNLPIRITPSNSFRYQLSRGTCDWTSPSWANCKVRWSRTSSCYTTNYKTFLGSYKLTYSDTHSICGKSRNSNSWMYTDCGHSYKEPMNNLESRWMQVFRFQNFSAENVRSDGTCIFMYIFI